MKYVYLVQLYRNPAYGLRSPDNRMRHHGTKLHKTFKEAQRTARNNVGPGASKSVRILDGFRVTTFDSNERMAKIYRQSIAD